MSKIESQAIKSTFFSYVGIVLGFISVGYLFPLILTKSELGAIRLVAQYAEIAAKVVALGSSTLIVRYFARFKDYENGHNGIFFWLLLLNLVGFTLFLVVYWLFGDSILARNAIKSPIFASLFYWILPLTLAMAVFNLFDGYLTALKMSTFGFFAKDFAQRLCIITLLGFAFFYGISFSTFSNLYYLILLFTPILMIVYTANKKELKLTPSRKLFTKPLVKEMASVSGFALLTGIGGALMMFIDSIMLNELINEASVSVYTTLAYYAILITVPARGVTKIGSTVIADALHQNDLKKVESIYYKSCLNQFIPGALVFIMLVVNLEFIFHILPDSYKEGYWLIYIIGLGHLFNVLTGINTQIIAYSPLHKFNSVFIFGLIILAVFTNWYFIPLYGVNGAAIATTISLFTFNLAKYILLYVKYHFQPFKLKYLAVVTLMAASIVICNTFSVPNPWWNAVAKSITGFSCFGLPIYFFNLAPEITSLINKKMGIKS